MRPFSKKSRRPQVEQLEDRCVPGSVLDLLGAPLLAPLGQSLVLLQATDTAVSLQQPGDRTTAMPSQPASPASRFSPTDLGTPGPVASRLAAGIEHSFQPLPGASGAGILVAAPGHSTQAMAGNVGSASAQQAPFLGRLEGVVTITPLAPPFLSVLVNATGNATQLGEFTLAIPHIVNRSNGTAIGSYQFTGANGDTLSADFTGQATPTPTPVVLSIVETATITGGTGRFAGATGGFICQRLFNAVAGTTVGSFNGTISVPVAGHH
jgi:hypothetical protein